ncbi:hypothetical protein AWJ20_2128 [Sugiyamaella lignohabitans]|uniref:Uncharacterized protein n=1 Tax=Sugiyamaella lignohabitans TaxID=796027 RepID=A0A167EW41_9ASCO|nr:uncharacterized protein AWJ20_2128 [Sugiyamaella lignohabitans]ANB14533.1 hypothetical protein AWJ20_2128 [Sugiyamaella lignohabitans]
MKNSTDFQATSPRSQPIFHIENIPASASISSTSLSPTSLAATNSGPPPIATPGRHSRQSSSSSIYSNSSFQTPAPPTPILGHEPRGLESRGRQASLNNRSSVSGTSSGGGISTTLAGQGPTKFTGPMSSVEIYDVLEKEQEAIVNKLQREINHLKTERSRSRSQSTSSSSSMTRNPSIRSIYSVSDAEEQYPGSSAPAGSVATAAATHRRGSRPSFGSVIDDSSVINSLRKENEVLKKKIAELSIKCKCSQVF